MEIKTIYFGFNFFNKRIHTFGLILLFLTFTQLSALQTNIVFDDMEHGNPWMPFDKRFLQFDKSLRECWLWVYLRNKFKKIKKKILYC